MRATHHVSYILFLAAATTILFPGREASAVTGWIFSEEIGFGAGSGLGHFNSPTGIAIGDLDRDGWPDLLIADSGNNRIQSVNFNTITGDPDFDLLAVQGTGLSTPKGIDVDTQRGLIFVADTGNDQVLVKDLRDGTIDGVDASVIAPQGVAVCCGGGGGGGGGGTPDTTMPDLLYIADTGNNRILRATFDPITGDPDFDLLMASGTNLGEVNAASSIRNTRGTSGPVDGYLFVADTGNNRIQRVSFDPITGDPDFDLLMGPGTGLGEVVAPTSVAGYETKPGKLHQADFIFVADTGNNRVQVGVDDGNNINWQFLGGGAVSMSAPGGLAVGDLTRDGRPDLVVADTGNNRLLLFVGVPEPSSLVLTSLAVLVIGIRCRRRNRLTSSF